MFSRRRILERRRKYTREFFDGLVQRLNEAGFNDISVVLPHNYSSVDPKNSIVSVQDFLSRERNYAATIVKASSTSKNELMKILFINSTAAAIFADDTFPSAASEPPALYFQSPDPARAYAVFEFFHEFLSEVSLRDFVILSVSSLISIVVLITEILFLVARKTGIISYYYGLSSVWDYILISLAVLVTYRFFGAPTGLWIKPKREIRLLYLAKMAIRGEYKDNPLVQLVITIIGGLIVAIIAKVFNLI